MLVGFFRGKQYGIEEGWLDQGGSVWPEWIQWLNEDRMSISQIKKSLELNKGFETHSRMYAKPLKSFKHGDLYQGS